MTETQNASKISRRKVLAGAAWATPAIVAVSATPALASSPFPVDCANYDISGVKPGATDVITWTRVVGTDQGLDSNGPGATFDTRLGQWQFAAKPTGTDGKVLSNVTGYRVTWEDQIVIRGLKSDPNGGVGKPDLTDDRYVAGPKDKFGHNSWTGHFTLRPNNNPLVLGAGLVYTGTIRSNMPYTGDCGKSDEGQHPYRTIVVSCPARLTFLKGLTPQSPESTDCLVYFNYIMKAGLACTTYRLQPRGLTTGTFGQAWVSKSLPEFPGSFA